MYTLETLMQDLERKNPAQGNSVCHGFAECLDRKSCPSNLKIYHVAVTLPRIACPKATLPITFGQFSIGSWVQMMVDVVS